MEDIDKAENDHSDFPQGAVGGGLLQGLGSGRGNFSPRDQSYDSNTAFQNSAISSRGKFSFQLDLQAANSSRQEASLQATAEQEEEDYFMSQDTSQWDVFADAAKFERREQILEKRRKAKIQAEMQVLRSDREFKV